MKQNNQPLLDSVFDRCLVGERREIAAAAGDETFLERASSDTLRPAGTLSSYWDGGAVEIIVD